MQHGDMCGGQITAHRPFDYGSFLPWGFLIPRLLESRLLIFFLFHFWHQRVPRAAMHKPPLRWLPRTQMTSGDGQGGPEKAQDTSRSVFQEAISLQLHKKSAQLLPVSSSCK